MSFRTVIIFVVHVYLWMFSLCISSQTQSQTLINEEILTSEFNAVGLVYHRFGDSRYPSTNTSVKAFESHLKYLNNNGFKTYTVSELLNKKLDEGKKVFITIDDGLKSFYYNALPLVKKYKVKVTVFVNTESVGWKDYMTWEQIREIEKAGVQIGSHSHKHAYFMNYPDSLRSAVFKADLLKSEEEFKRNLGYVPKVYAYPYGEFDASMVKVLKEKGYQVGFAQNSGVWYSSTNKWSIPRFPVSGEYVDLNAFKEKVNMRSLEIESNHLYPVVLSAQERFRFKLKIKNNTHLSSLNCFFNNKIYKHFTIEKGTIDVAVVMPSNKRRVLLTFTANDNKGNWYWWSCVFINSDVN